MATEKPWGAESQSRDHGDATYKPQLSQRLSHNTAMGRAEENIN